MKKDIKVSIWICMVFLFLMGLLSKCEAQTIHKDTTPFKSSIWFTKRDTSDIYLINHGNIIKGKYGTFIDSSYSINIEYKDTTYPFTRYEEINGVWIYHDHLKFLLNVELPKELSDAYLKRFKIRNKYIKKDGSISKAFELLDKLDDSNIEISRIKGKEELLIELISGSKTHVN